MEAHRLLMPRSLGILRFPGRYELRGDMYLISARCGRILGVQACASHSLSAIALGHAWPWPTVSAQVTPFAALGFALCSDAAHLRMLLVFLGQHSKSGNIELLQAAYCVACCHTLSLHVQVTSAIEGYRAARNDSTLAGGKLMFLGSERNIEACAPLLPSPRTA